MTHPLKMTLAILPDGIDAPCEMPAYNVPCEYNGEMELRTTKGGHLIRTCSLHLGAAVSIAHSKVKHRLEAAAERGTIDFPKHPANSQERRVTIDVPA